MTMDVTDGTVFGADALLQNWRRFSLHHGDIDLHLERLETGVEGSVVASVKLGFTITESTLNYVYPHLVAVDNQWPQLARRLTNQRLVLNGSIRFGWDSATGRVSSLGSKGDLLTPMLTLLGSLEDVAIVFDKALITPEGTFAE